MPIFVLDRLFQGRENGRISYPTETLNCQAPHMPVGILGGVFQLGDCLFVSQLPQGIGSPCSHGAVRIAEGLHHPRNCLFLPHLSHDLQTLHAVHGRGALQGLTKHLQAPLPQFRLPTGGDPPVAMPHPKLIKQAKETEAQPQKSCFPSHPSDISPSCHLSLGTP